METVKAKVTFYCCLPQGSLLTSIGSSSKFTLCLCWLAGCSFVSVPILENPDICRSSNQYFGSWPNNWSKSINCSPRSFPILLSTSKGLRCTQSVYMYASRCKYSHCLPVVPGYFFWMVLVYQHLHWPISRGGTYFVHNRMVLWLEDHEINVRYCLEKDRRLHSRCHVSGIFTWLNKVEQTRASIIQTWFVRKTCTRCIE